MFCFQRSARRQGLQSVGTDNLPPALNLDFINVSRCFDLDGNDFWQFFRCGRADVSTQVEAISKAIYLVTDLFENSEPLKMSLRRIAIDIVENLITRNKSLYKEDNLEFHCLDISKDELPPGDCIILRQVLQHLSNAEIQNIIQKIALYKYIILTEHIPIGNFILNKDIISGQGIRLKQNSGVNLLEAPFNLNIKEATNLGEHVLENNKGRIITTLYKTA